MTSDYSERCRLRREKGKRDAFPKSRTRTELLRETEFDTRKDEPDVAEPAIETDTTCSYDADQEGQTSEQQDS